MLEIDEWWIHYNRRTGEIAVTRLPPQYQASDFKYCAIMGPLKADEVKQIGEAIAVWNVNKRT